MRSVKLMCLLSVFSVFTPAMVLWRQWILRKRPSSTASRITTTAIMSFLVLFVSGGGILWWECVEERRVRKTLQMDDDFALRTALLTESALKGFFVTSVIYTTMLWLLKMAFLAYFGNVISILTTQAQILFIAVCVYTFVSYGTAIGFQFGYCGPVSNNWTLDPTTQCIHFQTLTVSTIQAVLNLSADLLVLTMALIIISSLPLASARDKAALLIVAGLGSVSIIMCAVRFGEMYMVITNGSGQLEILGQLNVWATLEVNFAVTAFCLPTFRALLLKRCPWLRAASHPGTATGVETIGGSDWQGRKVRTGRTRNSADEIGDECEPDGDVWTVHTAPNKSSTAADAGDIV